MSDVLQLKKETRRIFSEKRKALSASERELKDKILFDKTVSLDAYKNAEILLAYYPVKNEPNILYIVEEALRMGKKVAFPISNPEGFVLTFAFVGDLNELVTGAYSIPEPAADAEKYVNDEKTVCIVPGLAFDREGKRIGYGKGYYDRFLENFLGTSLGLCYADFLIDSLPVEKTDVSLDIIMSDKEEIFINA